MFKIGAKYLTYQQTRYFRNGAHMVQLGSIGTKSDFLGTFDHETLVPDIDTLLSVSPNHTVSVTFVGMRSSKGSGKFSLADKTEHLKTELKAGSGSSHVIIGKFDITDLSSIKMLRNVINDPIVMAEIGMIQNPAMADSIVKVAAMRKVNASDFNLGLSFEATIEEMFKLGVGVAVASSSLDDIQVSPGTVIGYRLVKLIRKGNTIQPKRDEPGI